MSNISFKLSYAVIWLISLDYGEEWKSALVRVMYDSIDLAQLKAREPIVLAYKRQEKESPDWSETFRTFR